MIINLNIIIHKQLYGSRRTYGVQDLKIISYRHTPAGYHTKRLLYLYLELIDDHDSIRIILIGSIFPKLFIGTNTERSTKIVLA